MRFYTVSPTHSHGFGYGEIIEAGTYGALLRGHARWADTHGITGIVFYTFNHSLDPWAAAGVALSETERLRPMIAVQPFHSHPYAVARRIASLSYLHQRPIDLNIVSGFNASELKSIGDTLDPIDRLARLEEFVRVLRGLLADETTYAGKYFNVQKATIAPRVPAEYRPCIFMPGGSFAPAAAVIRECADSSLLMGKPVAIQGEEIRNLSPLGRSMRHTVILGVIARATDEEAWQFARAHYGGRPADRMAARMLMANTMSMQHKRTSQLARQGEVHDVCLWYGAARTGIDCPKLVGSYESVRQAIACYAAIGVTDVVLDLPHDISEYEHIYRAIHSFLAPVEHGAVPAFAAECADG